MSIATNLAWQKSRYIAQFGSTIVLDKNPKPDQDLKALQVNEDDRISRYMGTDGLEGIEKVPVLFDFPGTLHGPNCPFVNGDSFLFADTLYTIHSLHPKIVSDVCIMLSVLAYKS